MIRYFHSALLLMALSGCGASATPTGTPEASAAAPGEECLAAAEAPRTPREDTPDSIGVSHILVRHTELERPQGAILTREAACLRALEALESLNESGDWNATVQEFSDSGKSTNGDLGSVGRDELTGAFGDAAFALEVDELSYVVESDRGFHIILRTQ